MSTISDGSETSSAFDQDLRKQGVFAQYLQVRNNSDNGVEVRRSSVRLSDGSVEFNQLDPDQVVERLQFSPSKRYFAWALALPLIGIVPGLIDGTNAAEANREIEHDVEDKTLKTRIVAKGERDAGFVFFDVPEDVTPQRVALTLNSGSQEKIDFTLPARQ